MVQIRRALITLSSLGALGALGALAAYDWFDIQAADAVNARILSGKAAADAPVASGSRGAWRSPSSTPIRRRRSATPP